MLKTIVLLDTFVETVIIFFFFKILCWIKCSKVQHFFKQIFCNIINVCNVILVNACGPTLLSSSIWSSSISQTKTVTNITVQTLILKLMVYKPKIRDPCFFPQRHFKWKRNRAEFIMSDWFRSLSVMKSIIIFTDCERAVWYYNSFHSLQNIIDFPSNNPPVKPSVTQQRLQSVRRLVKQPCGVGSVQ